MNRSHQVRAELCSRQVLTCGRGQLDRPWIGRIGPIGRFHRALSLRAKFLPRLFFGCLLLVSGVTPHVCCVAHAEEKAEAAALVSLSAEDVRELVSRLGAQQFVARESATLELFQAGQGPQSDLVLRLLTEAAEKGDREVRTRAKRVVRLVRDRLQRTKVEQFLAQKEVAGVPGWSRFRDVFGESSGSRKVYGELLSEEWDLLASCFPVSQEATVPAMRDATDERFVVLLRREGGFQKLSVGSLLCYFFVGAEYPEGLGTQVQAQLFYAIRSSTALGLRLRDAKLRDDSINGVTRRLVAKWLLETVKQNNAHETAAIYVTAQARMFDEAKLIASHILQNAGSSPVNKHTAMQIMAAMRDTEAIPLIEPYLTDERLLRNQKAGLQLRDVALVCLVDLEGHDLAKFNVKRTANMLAPYNLGSWGFQTQEDREKAFKAFEELQAEKRFQEKKRAELEAREKEQP